MVFIHVTVFLLLKYDGFDKLHLPKNHIQGTCTPTNSYLIFFFYLKQLTLSLGGLKADPRV